MVLGILFGNKKKSGVPASFEAFLGHGWYGVESNAEAVWAWSLGRAELTIPPRARRLMLHFSSIHQQLLHRPQEIRIYLDGALHARYTAGKQVNTVKLDCAGKGQLTLETEVLRPCDFPGHDDTRPLGICLLDYRVDGKRPSATQIRPAASEPEFNVIPNGPPQTLQVEITTACHLNCIMCSRPGAGMGRTPHMRPEIWERFFRAARQGEAVNFLGTGESFLNPRFTQYLRALDDAGVAVSFVTSGDLVDDRKAAELGALEHFSRISFSIDSPDPQVYRAIRGQDLARALAGLDRTLAAVRHPERIRVVSVVMKNNIESLLGFPELLARRGIRQFSMRGMIDARGTLQHLMPEYHERDLAILRTIKESCEREGITVSLLPSIPAELITIGTADFRSERLTPVNGQPENVMPAACPAEAACTPEPAVPQTPLCFDPWEMAIVTRDGLVQPCEVYHYQAAMGSLAEREFSEIWGGKPYNDFRRSLLCGNSVACRNCPRRGWGRHPLNLYAAELLPEQSRLSGPGPRRLVARNIGALPWDPQTQLSLAPTHPKDREDSAFYHPGWMRRSRIGSFREASVAPGELATFEFEVNPAAAPGREEHFQLVVEGKCWLPNTCFTIHQKTEIALATALPFGYTEGVPQRMLK